MWHLIATGCPRTNLGVSLQWGPNTYAITNFRLLFGNHFVIVWLILCQFMKYDFHLSPSHLHSKSLKGSIFIQVTVCWLEVVRISKRKASQTNISEEKRDSYYHYAYQWYSHLQGGKEPRRHNTKQKDFVCNSVKSIEKKI